MVSNSGGKNKRYDFVIWYSGTGFFYKFLVKKKELLHIFQLYCV